MGIARWIAMGTCVLFGAGCWSAWSAVDAVDPVDGPVALGTAASHEKACADGKSFAKAQCDRGARCASSDAYFAWGWTGEQCEHWVGAWYAAIFSLSSADERIEQCKKELEAPGCEPTPTCADLSRQKRRERGVACGGTHDCKVGLACVDGACGDRRAAGGACSDSDECAAGLSCQKGKCAAVQDGVTPCGGADDCHVARDTEGVWLFSTTRGADRFTCDDATLKCRAVVRDRAQGETCGDGKICAAGLYCKGWIYNGEGKCAPQIKFGEPCDDALGCLSCEKGICKDPLASVCK